MVTNLTNLTTAKTFYDIIVFTNQVTNGIVGMMFMLVIFLILLTQFTKRYEITEAITASSFLCFVLSIILTSINLLNFSFIIGFGIIFAFGGFYIQFTKT